MRPTCSLKLKSIRAAVAKIWSGHEVGGKLKKQKKEKKKTLTNPYSVPLPGGLLITNREKYYKN